MRTLFFTAFSLFFYTLAWAQPANDDCAGIIHLGTVPTCPGNTDIYDNIDATASDIGFGNIPDCFNGGSVDNDVWFSFTTTAEIVDVTVTLLGTDSGPNDPIMNPQIAIYRGDCEFDGLSELACISAPNGETFTQIDILGLTPGETYFIRVNDYSATAAPNWGDFTLCAEEYIPDINIGEETSTTACFGTLYDSGGPDEDYSSGENHTFTICPTDVNACINIEMASFNLENNFDFLNFYAGNTTAAPQIAEITGSMIGSGFPILVSSECVTIEFTSDGSGVNSGFELTWQCTPLECDGSDFDNTTLIPSIPFNSNGVSLCDGGATTMDNPCNNGDFMSGPEYIFEYDSPGGLCAEIQITNAPGGTGVLVLNGLPGDPGTVCVAQSAAGTIASANFEDPGTYYIIVGNPQGCGDFNISISEADCALSPALVDALCNPLNGCIEDGGVPSIFMFEDGFQDVPMVNGVNSGCWLGVGAQPDFYWFTIEAQADGPFGFILESADIPSDIDFNVWGPFTNEEVCENPASVIDYITNNEPIRSSYAGGTEPTGLADIHPQLGYEIEDVYDCQGTNDDIVQTIDAQVGEVYVVLANDWGNQIQGGGISVDWSPSQPEVLAPLAIDIMGQDTAVCPGETVQLSLSNSIDTYQWIDPTGTLSCTDCPDPVATVNSTTVYQVVVDLVCYVDTVDVKVFVYDVDAGPDLEVCLGEEFQLSAGSNFDLAEYLWEVPAGMTFSCTDCPDPVVTASTAGTYVINASLITDICTTQDQLTIEVNSAPAPDYTIIDDITICEGEDINVGGASGSGVTYTWTSNPPGFNSDEANPLVNPTVETTYILSAENGDCPTPVLDSVTVGVEIAPIVTVANDTTICQGEVIQLGFTELEEGVVYNWTGPAAIEYDTAANTLATPEISGVYALNATRGVCEVIETVNVEVVEIAVDITQDTVYICLGESVDLDAFVLPAGEEAAWVPDDGSLSSQMGNNIVATPLESTWYFASHSVPGCGRTDSVYIRVDSLPDLSILATPEKDPYCEGDLITLLSNTYEPSSFPDIESQWLNGPGFQTPDSLWNLVITAQDSFLYQRVTVNNACSDTASIQINVVETPFISIEDQTICAGDELTMEASSDLTDGANEEFEWMYNGMTSNDEILTISGLTSTTDITLNYTYGDDCGPITETATVTVVGNDMTVTIDSEPDSIYFGETAILNATVESDPPVTGTLTYEWFVNGVSIGTSDVPTFTATNISSSDNDDTLADISVTVTTEEGCEAMGSSTITILLAEYEIPNVFTPNGDNLNDIFQVYHTEGAVNINSLQVFNRWGQLVFESTSNEAWDGNYKGEPAQADVYIYHAIIDQNGEVIEVSGEVTLLR